MPQPIDHLEPEPTPPVTPAGVKAIKLSLAPLTLDEPAEVVNLSGERQRSPAKKPNWRSRHGAVSLIQ